MAKRGAEETYEENYYGSPKRSCVSSTASSNLSEETQAALQAISDEIEDMANWQDGQDPWAYEVLEETQAQCNTSTIAGTHACETPASTEPVHSNSTNGQQNGQCTSTTLDTVTTIGDDAVNRKFRFYRTVKGKEATKSIIGYVFHADLLDEVNKLFKLVRNGKHDSVIWYALGKHAASPCSGLFEEPTDHYHMMVWFDDKSKAQDKAFHKWFYRYVHGKQWKSQTVRSERGLLQYMQCEPRELVELYSSAQHAKFVQHCYETRHEMQAKIETRDAKKTKGTAKINYVSENDWWQEHDCNPQAIVNCMVQHGIRDVNRFLLWLSEHEPDKTMRSLTFHREKARLEKEINMSVRRHWYTKNILPQLEARRSQCESLEKRGMVMSVKDSVAACKDIIQKNGYDFQKFVNDVFNILFKRKNKVNTLYLFGKSNSCKSTIAWSIINCTPNYSQGMASTEFMYQLC